jgi:hypothetical protein
MITGGGEIDFIKRIVNESLSIRSRIRWYTSMVGKKSSLKMIVRYLKEQHIDNYVTTELVQGRTHRWVIGWSFVEKVSKAPPPSLPEQLHFVINMPSDHVFTNLQQFFQNYDIVHEVTSSIDQYIILTGYIKEDVWSRKARRKKLAIMNEAQKTISSRSNDDVGLFIYKFTISIIPISKDQCTFQMKRITISPNPSPSAPDLFLSLYNRIKRYFGT